jgi:hypothetical protein
VATALPPVASNERSTAGPTDRRETALRTGEAIRHQVSVDSAGNEWLLQLPDGRTLVSRDIGQ